MDIETTITAVAGGRCLTRDETTSLFTELMAGHLHADAVERLLLALSARGEAVDEIAGAAIVMRRHVVPIPCDEPDAIDTCGTGGDGISTFNVSTAAALVAAAAGATVAKHGNRTNSRRSGSAEVLEALGVRTDASPEAVAHCLREARIGFLHAARLHPAMAHVSAIRRKIGRPTIFNLLGPLTNPAGVRRQIIGVPRVDLMPMVAAALQQLGAVRAWVVHGDDGLCDLTTTDTSRYIELMNGRLTEHTLTPESVGLPRTTLSSLLVDSPAASAATIRSVLSGEDGPARSQTLLNAAAALVVAGIARDLRDGLDRSARAIDSGAARQTLQTLVHLTHV